MQRLQTIVECGVSGAAARPWRAEWLLCGRHILDAGMRIRCRGCHPLFRIGRCNIFRWWR